MNELYINDCWIYFATKASTYDEAMDQFLKKCVEADIDISIVNAKLRDEDGNDIEQMKVRFKGVNQEDNNMVIYIDYKFCTNGTFKLIHLEELNCKEVGLYEYVGHEKIKVNDKSDTIEIAANFLAKLLCRNIDVDPRYYWVLESLYEMINSLVDFIKMYKSGNVVQRKYLMSPGDKNAITVRIEEE